MRKFDSAEQRAVAAWSLRSEIMSRIVVEDRVSGPFVTVVKGPGF